MRKINSAPKDGSEIIIFASDQFFIGWWDNGWKTYSDTVIIKNPTHWEPLPDKPKIVK